MLFLFRPGLPLNLFFRSCFFFHRPGEVFKLFRADQPEPLFSGGHGSPPLCHALGAIAASVGPSSRRQDSTISQNSVLARLIFSQCSGLLMASAALAASSKVSPTGRPSISARSSGVMKPTRQFVVKRKMVKWPSKSRFARSINLAISLASTIALPAPDFRHTTPPITYPIPLRLLEALKA